MAGRRGQYIGNLTAAAGLTGTPLQTEAAAYFARMSVAPGATFRKAVNQAIFDWKAAGLWTKIKALWLFCADTQQAALLSVIGDTARDATVTGAPVHYPGRGFSGLDASHRVNFGGVSQAHVGASAWTFFAGRCATYPEFTFMIICDGTMSTSNPPQGTMFTAGLNTPDTGVVMGGAGWAFCRWYVLPGVQGMVIGGRGQASVGGIRCDTTGSSVYNTGNNYRTNPINGNPLARLSAYGFVDGTATTVEAQKFNAILERMIIEIGALD